jgi:hypothetical protein
MLPNIGIQKVSVSIPAVAINAKIKTIKPKINSGEGSRASS